MHTEQIILWDTKYGKIHCDLAGILKKKRITVYQIIRLSGIKYDVIMKYYEDNVHRYDCNVLAKLCYSLNCDIGELLKYRKSMW